jgi:hypothetical protein
MMKRSTLLTSLALWSTAIMGCQSAQKDGHGAESPLARICRELVQGMGDPRRSVSEHYEAESMLLASEGKDAVRSMIDAQNDDRVFDPAFVSPAGPPSSKRFPITVGKRVKMLLPEIIGADKFSLYRVADWEKWWQDHVNASFDDIRLEVKAAGNSLAPEK